MSAQPNVRSAYVSSAIETASPAKLLLMLLDRLVLDVERAGRAQASSEWQQAGHQFVHAQAIVTELMGSLQVDGWTGGRELMSLYIYLSRRLVQANVKRDSRAAKECLWLAQNITQMWKQAAKIAANEAKGAER